MRTRNLILAVGVIWSVAPASTLRARPLEGPPETPAIPPTSMPQVTFGSLEITTEPGTTILWEGVELGLTDDEGRMQVSRIPLGSYAITARREGYEPLEQQISVDAGSQRFALSLSKPSASVQPDSLPDPFARRTTFFGVLLPSILLLIVAGGSLLLLRRRHEPEEDEPGLPADGPHLAFEQDRFGSHRPPRFYDDLRQREATLEGFEDREAGRPASKVIELPVSNREPREGDP